MVPHLGLIRTSFLFGCVNVGVALAFAHRFQKEGRWGAIIAQGCLVLLLNAVGLVGSDYITGWAEDGLYPAPVVFSDQSPYQKIAVTSNREEIRLYLNGNLQFSSFDEYRYHESLVVPALLAHPNPSKVLVLGGGDGLAVRLLLQDPRVKSVTLVELDAKMIELFRDHEELARLNGGVLRDPRVKVVQADAFRWLEQEKEMFDVALVDFPDPSSYAVGKLYTDHFYRRLAQHLTSEGVFVVQSSSPLAARKTYWSVVTTIESIGWSVIPYHAYVPSFGEWGFVLASRRPLTLDRPLPFPTRFLNAQEIPRMLSFANDMSRVPVKVNRIFDQVLVRYFAEDWSQYGREGY
jgi:spermidine synthase